MKIIKIIKAHRKASEEEIKKFIYKNMSQEMIAGLEYDDPKTMMRALKMFGIDSKEVQIEAKNDDKVQSSTNDTQKHH